MGGSKDALLENDGLLEPGTSTNSDGTSSESEAEVKSTLSAPTHSKGVDSKFNSSI